MCVCARVCVRVCVCWGRAHGAAADCSIGRHTRASVLAGGESVSVSDGLPCGLARCVKLALMAPACRTYEYGQRDASVLFCFVAAAASAYPPVHTPAWVA